jgi:hypothetical protein
MMMQQPNFLRCGPNTAPLHNKNLLPPRPPVAHQSRVLTTAPPNNIVSLNSLSQQTSSPSIEESPPQDGGRAQAKFQELVSRSRHLESMELLHDIKKRLTNLEELVASNNTKLYGAINNLEKKIDLDAEGAICATTQIHHNQNILIMDVIKKLDVCYEKIDNVETTLHDMNKCCGASSPDSDDAMSVGCYMKSKITEGRTTILEGIEKRKCNEEFDPMSNCSYEFHQLDSDNDNDEVSSNHSHMTEPIKYQKGK